MIINGVHESQYNALISVAWYFNQSRHCEDDEDAGVDGLLESDDVKAHVDKRSHSSQ